MVESALQYVRMLEKNKFSNIVISLKASNASDTVIAYRQIARVSDYPLHLGVTATGLSFKGAIASSVAIGSLLIDGIGDTIRVSLTDNPKEEIKAARAILEAAGLRQFGPQVISCPTCGRCEVNLVQIVKQLDQALTRNALFFAQRKPMKVAVMGCVVNGPGEAKEADIGIAFGKGEGLLFKHGKPVRKVADSRCVEMLIAELKNNSDDKNL
jgi:(E)-4-hydroxy-3-methylbut-2-enyl-diphosphate synthase